MEAGRAQGAAHFVLLSAICVQKPLLEFQRAKLAFEEKLQVGVRGRGWGVWRWRGIEQHSSGLSCAALGARWPRSTDCLLTGPAAASHTAGRG